MQHRDGDAGQMAVQVNAPPVRTVALVREVIPKVRGGFGQQVGPVAQRQVAVPGVGQRAGEVLARLQVAFDFFDKVGSAQPLERVDALVDGVGNHPAPFHRPAGVVNPALVKIRRSRNRRHHPKVRREGVAGGEGVLDRAHVGLAGRADPAVRPGLAGGPLHGVVAVLNFLEQRIVKLAFGLKAGPAVLGHHRVAVPGEEPDRMIRVVEIGVLAVGAADYQHRVPARDPGPDHVARQKRPVAHGDFGVSVADHFVGQLLKVLPARLRRA